VAHYWVIDALDRSGLVLTEFGPGENGSYEILGSTDKVFTTEAPYPVTIDLPALTARCQAMLEHARPTG
jgi:hypothetical protein